MARRQAQAIVIVLIIGVGVVAGGCGQSEDDRFEEAFRTVLLTTESDVACGPVEVAPLVPDCPVEAVCFTEACTNHNDCYSVCGASKGECDQTFFDEMVGLCDSNLAPLDENFSACRYMALLYWTAVIRYGDGAFDATQGVACEQDDTFRGEPGACCRTGGEGPFCENVDDSFDCPIFSVFMPHLTCDEVEDSFGGCPVPPNDACDRAEEICKGQVADDGMGRCAGGEGTFGEGQVCDIYLQDCGDEVACLPLEDEAIAFRCSAATDTRLADTDGPEGGGGCVDSGPENFQADVWFKYVAPCTGTMTIQMCHAGLYDSMLAIYGSSEAGGMCPCPEDNEQLLICNDDYCGGFGTLSGAIVENVVGGACYTIRVGGWSRDGTEVSSQRGTSELDIGVFCDTLSTPVASE